ncbi:MAG: DUF4340 domain-containing protein [Firmicutes bacterium]|nr:DUF4340 domain-containing protein [Bacillota bacterium]
MMTKQLKSTGILVVILVILAGAAWWLISTQETAVSKKTVFKMPEKEIIRLTLQKTDTEGKQTKVVLNKVEADKKGKNKAEDGKWEIIEPILDPAYATTVENMLQTLAKVEAEVVYQDSKEAGNLADYGLAPAALTVQADFKGQKPSKKILIGSQTPVLYKFFAKFEDEPQLLTVQSTVKSNLEQDLNALRDKQLMANPKEQIQSVRLWSDTDKAWYQLKRQNGAWRLTQPFQDIGLETFDSILTSLMGLLINEYLEATPNLAQYGLDRPSQQVEMTLDRGERVSIKAALKDEKWYLTSTQRVGIFQFNNASALDFLKVGLKDLVGKNLANYGEKEIESITIQVGSAPERKLKGKDFTEIRKQLLLGQTVQPYFKASKPVTRAEYDSQAPLYRIALTVKGKGLKKELKFYPNPEKKDIQTYLATDSERPFVYELRDTENERTLLDKLKNVK